MSTEETSLAAWKMVGKNRKFAKGLIFHSDRGVQYASKKFAKTIESYGLIRSMIRKGNCWDNAAAESFFKSLKTELIYGNNLITKVKMEIEIFEYIEIWYKIEEFNNQNEIYQNVA
ncbi:IS3 family transposase [Chryseobacterium soli]|uniref:DDE-type integrase/transposase/recombinase n=1 Tax=Chryseobacterium soli TaxID=445961 RepID=UPI0029546121|nr:DDE-type integrase/transposase/recombinase [Chryseobacterium soli]MDV7698234.1 IS3 family transposase [Chryseobacterium soli]